MPECLANLCIVLHLSPCVVCMYVHDLSIRDGEIEGLQVEGQCPLTFPNPVAKVNKCYSH